MRSLESMLRSVLVSIARFSVFHARTVLVVAGLTTGLALWLASGLSLSTNVMDLLPHDSSVAERMRDLFERYGSSEPVAIALSKRSFDHFEDFAEEVKRAGPDGRREMVRRIEALAEDLEASPQDLDDLAEEMHAIAEEVEADENPIEEIEEDLYFLIEELDERLDETRFELAREIRRRLFESDLFPGSTPTFGADPWALLDTPEANALLLYFQPEEIDALIARLDDAGIEAQVDDNKQRLRSPMGAFAADLIVEDPLALAANAARHFEKVRGTLKIRSGDGALVTGDGRFVIVLATAAGPPEDVAVARKVLAEVESVTKAAIEQMRIDASVGVGPAVEGDQALIHVGLSGRSAIVVDYQEILTRDVRFISVVAFWAVLILFLIGFRRPGGVLVAGVPLVVGIIWTLGFASVTVGRLSVFTAPVISILCGLAIDFTIHLYNRYLEEVHAGRDMARAFAAAHGGTGLSIIAAAATTAWAFLAAGFSRFEGLRELGVICAGGMVLSLLACLWLVPAMTSVSARIWPGRDRPRGLAGFGLGPLLTAVIARPKTVVGIVVVALALLMIPASRVALDEDFRRFRPTHAASIQLQGELAAAAGTLLETVLVLVPGESDGEVLENAQVLESALLEFVSEDPDNGFFSAVWSPSRVLPPPSQQRAILEKLKTARSTSALDPDHSAQVLRRAMVERNFAIDERAERAIERVRSVLSRTEPLTVADAREGLLRPLMEHLIIEERDGRPLGVITCYVRPGVKTGPLVNRVRSALDATGTAYEIVGSRVLSQEVKKLVLRDGWISVLIASVGVIVILGVTFRSALLVFLTFIPLIVGVLAAVGWMALLGVDFNLVSISMVPLILGIGIDNGIHVVHRFTSHSRENLVDVFEHTGRGVVMTSLTTMVGFGAMIFADYPGLVSSGILAILGVGFTLITAVSLLPALLRLIHVRKDTI